MLETFGFNDYQSVRGISKERGYKAVQHAPLWISAILKLIMFTYPVDNDLRIGYHYNCLQGV